MKLKTHSLVPLRTSSLYTLGVFEHSGSEVRDGSLRWVGIFLEDASSTRDDERILLSVIRPRRVRTELRTLEPILCCLSSCSFLERKQNAHVLEKYNCYFYKLKLSHIYY